MAKGRVLVSLCKYFTLTRSPGLHVLRRASLKWDCGAVALNVLSLEEDKVREQSSDDAMSVVTALPVSSLAGSD